MTRAEWPQGMAREPWKHQHDAYDRLGSLWFAGQPGVGLISDMGTGKSLVATALFVAYGFHRTLIVSGTKAMVEEWPDTIAAETCGALEGVPLVGKLDDRVAVLKARQTDSAPLVFVTNVESYWSGKLGAAIERTPWDCIVFDESQKIKAAGSKASLFAYLLAKRYPQAKRLILTGTPLHDKPLDAYGQYRFLDPRIFGTNYSAFEDRYAIKRQVSQSVYRVESYKNLDELAAKIHAVSFRVDDSVIDLPPIVEHDRKVRLTEKTARVYRDLDKTQVAEIEGSDDAVIASNVLAEMTRLQQVTSGYVITHDSLGVPTTHVLGTEKRDALVSLLDDLDVAKPVVVFARFTHDLSEIASAAAKAGRPYCEQSGARQEWREWRARSDNAVLGVQIQAGGAGIDLTRSPYAVFYSHSFSLGDFRQAVKRVHRPGQTERTFVYHLLATIPGNRSIDTTIRAAIRDKREIAEYVVDTYRKAQV